MPVTVTKTVIYDAAMRQVHRVRIVGTSIASTTVAEIEVGTHVPRACVLQRVHEYASSGTMTERQPDVWQGEPGQSVVGATWPQHYQATSTAKATQINDTHLGLVLALEDDDGAVESLYYREVPDAGNDNAYTTDLYFLPVTEGQ